MNELKLKSIDAPTGDYAGLDFTNFVLEFEEPVNDLKEGDLITPDFRDGQTLFVVSVDKSLVTCRLANAGKTDYFNPKYAQKETKFYKLELPYVKEYGGEASI